VDKKTNFDQQDAQRVMLLAQRWRSCLATPQEQAAMMDTCTQHAAQFVRTFREEAALRNDAHKVALEQQQVDQISGVSVGGTRFLRQVFFCLFSSFFVYLRLFLFIYVFFDKLTHLACSR